MTSLSSYFARYDVAKSIFVLNFKSCVRVSFQHKKRYCCRITGPVFTCLCDTVKGNHTTFIKVGFWAKMSVM